jgi:hypothetical protein
MPNPRTPDSQKPNQSGGRSSATEEDKLRKQTPGKQQRAENDGDTDRVEIGDPVPEEDRPIKASRVSPGETGEDEDLPDENGVEGSKGRH